MAEHGSTVVRLLRSLIPGGILQVPVARGRAVVCAALPSLVLLPAVEAHGGVESFAERLSTHKHPNDLGVQPFPQRIEHGGKHDIREAGVGEVFAVDLNTRPQNLVHHRAGVGIPAAVKVLGVFVTDGDSVGLSVRHDHEGGNLNVVCLDPIDHELRDNGDRLNGRSPAQVQGIDGGVVLLNIAVVEHGEKPLTIRCLVGGRAKVGEGGVSVVERGVHLTSSLHGELLGKFVPLLLLDRVHVPATPVDRVNLGEGEHLKRNLRLLAEPNQLKGLKEAGLEGTPHRPAEVQQEHDAVILAVLLDDLRQEDVIVGAELMEAVKVQHSGLLRTLTANLVRSLAAVELRDQLTDKRIGLLRKLAVRINGEGNLRLLVGALKLAAENIGGDDRLAVILRRNNGENAARPLLTALATKLIGTTRDEALGNLLAIRRIGGRTVLALALALLLLLLRLLDDLLHGGMLVDALGNIEHLVKGGHGVDHVHELLLVCGQVDVDEAGNAPLHVEVEAVDEVRLRPIHLGKLKDVLVHDLLVAQEEVAAGAGELVLHQLLNADIFDGVGNHLKHRDAVAFSLRSLDDLLMLLVGSPQGVADLMGDEHGHHRFRHIPHRHDEVTALGVERCGFRVLVKVERDVLGSESAGKDGERGVHARIVPDAGWKVKV